MSPDSALRLASVVQNVLIVGIVFYSIILHEISHAKVADWLGDDTARRMKRLSLNPLKHIDPIGTVLLPLVLFITMRVIFGYAKPVPLNPYNFRNVKRDIGLSALAGPVTNILIAVLFAVIFHLTKSTLLLPKVCVWVVYLNLLLAFFNMIPVPPLDGSKVLGIFLSDQAYMRWTAQGQIGMYAIFGVLIISQFLGISIIGSIVQPPIMFLMRLLGIF
jgi:Zn-dependent protease